MEIATTNHLDAMTNRVRWSEVYHVLKKPKTKLLLFSYNFTRQLDWINPADL